MTQRITMRTLLFLFLFVSANAEKGGKAFSLFSVVTFKNEDCQSESKTTMAGNRNGTCYTSTECSDKGGMASGNCAMGFGTCCIFLSNSCGDEINQNVTYVRNENFPTALTGTSLTDCTYTVKKCSDNICRVRLDFEQFTILGATGTDDTTANQACVDSFTVTGLSTGSSVVPTICGANNGQHIYFELGEASGDTATLSFKFGATAGSRDYEIRVSQFPCSSALTPPEGCLQWHTGTDGRLTTFNFEADTTHLASQDYSICIRREEGMCCIEYQACSDDRSMTIGAVDAAAKSGAQCTNLDWIEIENSGASCGAAETRSRYCGSKLTAIDASDTNSPVCDCTAPFSVGVRTDASDAADAAGATGRSRGVCLEYVQKPC